ncbi:MAG: rRNA maturation RNase YbeY [Bacteroidia bacterium]|nr:rRNA maturation RNase YbeY [Bacteroidia bacterium]
MDSRITFFSEDTDFSLTQEDSVKDWVLAVMARYQSSAGSIAYIFCSDEFLLGLNRAYLNHDYYTDILTFPTEEPGIEGVAADIYISVDRVRDNAAEYRVSFEDELHRVMIHGVLHLLGLDDHGEAEMLMRKAEDEALSLRSF